MISIDLSGKVAVVTGGGQGLGLATVRRLHAAGARVAVNFLDDAGGVNRRTAESALAELGDAGLAAPGDVRSRAGMEQFFDSVVAKWGRVDLLVNNAAILRDRTLKNLSDAEWDDVIETNLSGVFRVCKAALPRMQDGGRIVSMASISGVIGFFGQANYASAKAGVIAMTKVLSKELAPRRITVNAVAPGVVLTEMGKSIPDEVRAQMIAQIPLRRFGEPDEISNVIAFLCSDLASYVTGQTIHVNGGWWA